MAQREYEREKREADQKEKDREQKEKDRELEKMKIEAARKDKWASYLSALLKGRALEVFVRLSKDDQSDYGQIKEALLPNFDLTERSSRKRFRVKLRILTETRLIENQVFLVRFVVKPIKHIIVAQQE